MRDRISTKILDNGATRYGVYDEDGNLLRYEYIKLEDEPDEEGDFFNKANMLPDHIPALLGLKMGNPQVKDALNVLAKIGNVHVWSFTDAGGNTEFLTSTNHDAYPNGEIGRQEAGYTLGAVETNKAISEATHSSNMGGTICKVASAVSVSEFGEVSLANPTNLTLAYSNTPFTSSLAGKFVMVTGYSAPVSGASHNCPVGLNTIFYIPADATVVTSDYDADATYHFQIVASKFQTVTGYPATNAGEYTYLGQLGDKARLEVGSYVGTGKSGSANSISLTFGFEPKLVIVGLLKRSGTSGPGYGLIPSSGNWATGFVWFKGQEQTLGSGSYAVYISQTKKTLSWYGSKNEQDQQNVSGYTYGYIAIG